MRVRLRFLIQGACLTAICGAFACMMSSEGSLNGDEMPQFPLHPPQWTLRHQLPQGLLTQGTADNLGATLDTLVHALNRAGYADWSVYGYRDAGFAVATRMERIQDDGSPDQDRWLFEHEPSREFSLRELLSRLFQARPGHFRVIVFIVTQRVVTPGDGELTDSTATKWYQEGAADLPYGMRRLVVDSLHTEALIYEFRRPDEDVEAVQVDSDETGLTGVQHLVRAGLWESEQILR